MFMAVLLTVAKKWKQPKKCLSTDEWIGKVWSIRTMEYYSALERKEVLPHDIIWMSPTNMLSEVNQSQEEKCSMIPLI